MRAKEIHWSRVKDILRTEYADFIWTGRDWEPIDYSEAEGGLFRREHDIGPETLGGGRDQPKDMVSSPAGERPIPVHNIMPGQQDGELRTCEIVDGRTVYVWSPLRE